MLQWQILLVVLLWLFTRDGSWSWQALGVNSELNSAVAFLGGVVIYGVMLGGYELLLRVLPQADRLRDAAFEAMRSLWPRDAAGKWQAFLAVCVLNPFTEELVYRGVLVYGVGTLTGHLAIAAIAVLSLSIAAHLYQGFALTLFHLAFHGLAILVLLSPLGLVGCFGLHFAGDLIPVLAMKHSMQRWAARRRLKHVAPPSEPVEP